MKTIKFCDYIQSILKFERGDTHLFVRFSEKYLNLIRNIRGKRVFVYEIGRNSWKVVEYDIDNDDKICPVSVSEILKALKKK